MLPPQGGLGMIKKSKYSQERKLLKIQEQSFLSGYKTEGQTQKGTKTKNGEKRNKISNFMIYTGDIKADSESMFCLVTLLQN